MYPRLPFLLLPYARAELPGWGRLLRWVGALGPRSDEHWAGAPYVTVRGKQHRFLMNLDLSNWSQRMTYFLGRYYELGVLRVLDVTLQPGERFVDIGANIGMITLHALSRVGPSGQVDCVEPNPDCVAKIQEHLRLNGVANVRIHACALSDEPGSLDLNLTSAHTGTATLADVDGVVKRIAVAVGVGDDVLSAASDALVGFIKIDVEGFELHVLKGLRKTLTNDKPFVVTELIEDQLARAGTSVREVANYLFDLGYEAFGIKSARRFVRHQLRLERVEWGDGFERFSDVLWAHPSGAGWSRLVPCSA
jgi:FkbM family methyltransferase